MCKSGGGGEGGGSPTISSGRVVLWSSLMVMEGGRGEGRGGVITTSSGREALWSSLMVMALNPPRATTARESPAYAMMRRRGDAQRGR